MSDLAEKILQNINNVFANDPLLDEYDILAANGPSGTNKNPVVVAGHKMGVEAWAVGAVYSLCYSHMRAALGRGRGRLRDPARLSECTRVVVMVVAECMTAWNLRKELLSTGHLGLSEELHLLTLVLTKHPKSAETFQHRKWLVTRQLLKPAQENKNMHSCPAKPDANSTDSKPNPPTTIRTCLCEDSLDGSTENSRCCASHSPGGSTEASERCVSDSPGVRPELCEAVRHRLIVELDVCQSAALRYANNYHAWTHRIWVLQQTADTQLLESELHASDVFLRERVSDHSAYHHRVYVIRRLYTPQSTVVRRDALVTELGGCTESLTAYPGHEALWYYRRALLHELLKHSPSHDTSAAKKPRNTPSTADTRQQELALCEREAARSDVTATRELLWQRELAHRHRDWLDRRLGVETIAK